MKILALSGSLRVASINGALLRAAARLAPQEIDVALSQRIGTLPLFNPDLESQPPQELVAFRNEVAAADALLIASPEYAHGVTGAMKNALDWLVSFEPFVGKPVAVLNASPRAHHADDALRETLKTMSAVIVEEASVTLPLVGAGLSENEMVESEAIARAVRSVLDTLYRFVSLQRSVLVSPSR